MKGFEMYSTATEAFSGETRGRMSARIIVQYTDANGVTRFRKVLVHREFHTSESESRSVVKALREHNHGVPVEGTYTLDL